MRVVVVACLSLLPLLLPSLARASVSSSPRLLDEALVSPVVGAFSRPSLSARLDDGSGGGAGSYLLEGCSSMVTELGVSLVLGIVVGVSIAAGNGSDAAVGGALAFAVIGVLLTPLLTSAVVYGIAKGFGDQPSYGRIVLFSYAARLSFVVLGLVVKESSRVVVSGIGAFAGAIAEVYAANGSAYGSAGDTVATLDVTPPARPVARAAPSSREERSASMMSYAFRF